MLVPKWMEGAVEKRAAAVSSVPLSSHVFLPSLTQQRPPTVIRGHGCKRQGRARQAIISSSVGARHQRLSALEGNTWSKPACCNGYGALPDPGASKASCNSVRSLQMRNALG